MLASFSARRAGNIVEIPYAGVAEWSIRLRSSGHPFAPDRIRAPQNQPGFTHLALSNEERRVINIHRNLERYLDLPESERMTGG